MLVSPKGVSEHGTIYTGVSTNVHQRLRVHNGEINGSVAKNTRRYRPWALGTWGLAGSKSEAHQWESRIKKWKAEKKRNFIADHRGKRFARHHLLALL